MSGLRSKVVAGTFGLLMLTVLFAAGGASAQLTGAIYTSLEDGSAVNANHYDTKEEVYLNGGPRRGGSGLPDGNYYFQVTDPSGASLLSSDPVLCREFRVAGGLIVEFVSQTRTYTKGNKVIPCWIDGMSNGRHDIGVDADTGSLNLQLMPYDNTPNRGGVYKTWATGIDAFVGDPSKVDNACGTGCHHGFVPAHSKTDNYKVRRGGNFVAPVITVQKFLDIDGDGVWDAGEPEIGVSAFVNGAGWPVSLVDPYGAESSDFTPALYYASGTGNHVVTEGAVAGWAQTAAYLDGAAQPLSPTVNVNVAYKTGETHNVIFGNFECFAVSGHKVNDLDGDGTWDAGEPTIAGWTISLYRNGALYASTSTDEAGAYSFTVCAGGDYEVREAMPDGWAATSAAAYFFTAYSGVDQSTDFLNFRCFTVSGHKVEDNNGNGVWDSGEPTISGWTITLSRNGVPVDSTITDENGAYSFRVCAGGDYTVEEETREGWVATSPNSYSFTAVSGQNQEGDFLNFELGRICGTKFFDSDHDGARDAGEPGIAGWRITVSRDGVAYAVATTGADGSYCFTDLLWGEYTVSEVMPLSPGENEIWVQTYPGGDGSWHVTGVSGLDFSGADFGNVCEFTESRTWGYWKTHTGNGAPPRDEAYDLLPANPLDIDLTTPDGDDLVETDAEAYWMFTSTSPDCSGDCRSLFRAQLLALHMSMLKFAGMGGMVYVYEGDPNSGMTVQAIHDAAVALLNDGAYHDFTAFQETLDRINNNHNYADGSHVLVCANPAAPVYP